VDAAENEYLEANVINTQAGCVYMAPLGTKFGDRDVSGKPITEYRCFSSRNSRVGNSPIKQAEVDFSVAVLDWQYDTATGKETLHHANGVQFSTVDHNQLREGCAYRFKNWCGQGSEMETMQIFRGWSPIKLPRERPGRRRAQNVEQCDRLVKQRFHGLFTRPGAPNVREGSRR